MKRVLTIAGSDCSGGAGVQADLKTFCAHGVYGMSVIVSVVAENTRRVLDVQDVRPDLILKQLDAVFEDIGADAVKVGMLSTPRCMRAVAQGLACRRPPHIVIDPVMFAKNGAPLMQPDAVEPFIRHILPLADVLTPNIPEAERLTGLRIRDTADMERAARALSAMGCRAVVLKGGHGSADATDVLFDGKALHYYSVPRIATRNTHGTGCTFSAAIAAGLANGLSLPQAVERAKGYVTSAIAHALPLGKGCGPTHHLYELYRQAGWNV